MKKMVLIMAMILALLIIPNAAAKDVTSGFTITDIKFCSDETCATEYDDTNEMTAYTYFLAKINWAYNGPAIANGDTASFDFGNEVYTETSTAWSGSFSWSDINVTGLGKIGQWRLINPNSATHKIEIKFSDNAIGKTSITGGELITTKSIRSNYYVASDFIVVPFTVKDRVYNLKLSKNILTESKSVNVEYALDGVATNKTATFRLTTPNLPFSQLYRYNEYTELTPNAIYNNIVCEIKAPEGTTMSKSERIRVVLPTDITNHYASGYQAITYTADSCFTEKTPNNGETKEEFKARLNANEWGIYTDTNGDQYYVVNYGNLPSEDYTYQEIMKKEPGEIAYEGNPFTNNSAMKEIYNTALGSNNIIGGAIAQWRTVIVFTYPQVATIATPVESSSTCNWTDGTGASKTYQKTSKGNLIVPQATAAIPSGTAVLKLYDEDLKGGKPLSGATIKLEKKNGSTWTALESKTTDENGKVEFTSLGNGTYRFSQPDNGYLDHYTVGSYKAYETNLFTGTVSEFTINDNGKEIYATNKRQSFTTTYKKGDHGTFNDVTYIQLYDDVTKQPTTDELTHDEGWVFDKWDAEIAQKVTENKTYTALWYKNITITVKHVDEEGNEIDTNKNRTYQARNNTPYEEKADQDLLHYYTVDKEIVNGTTEEQDIEITFTYTAKPASIIERHLDKDTGSEIVPDKTINVKYNERYNIKPIEKEGYTLVEDSGNTEGVVTKDETVVIYYYKYKEPAPEPVLPIKYNIIVNITKGKGYVQGDEIVEEGKNSTVGKIVIEAQTGSYISKILIDGKEYKIEKEAKRVVLPYFKNIKQNHVIDVEFDYLAGSSKEVPKTGNVLSIVWPVLLITLVTLSLFLVRLYSNKGKIKEVK